VRLLRQTNKAARLQKAGVAGFYQLIFSPVVWQRRIQVNAVDQVDNRLPRLLDLVLAT